MILRHTFTPYNNTRLSHLCGPADAHLRTIEVGMQVKIAHRHEQFKVDGPKAKAQDAMELLQALYEMADDPISEDTLQLMLAGDVEMLEPTPTPSSSPPAVPTCAHAHPTRPCTCRTLPSTTSPLALAPQAQAKPIWPWPAPWMHWSAVPCSASS